MSLSAGVTLGAYTIIERIGRGGMATVYKAYHPALDRYAAIKVLPEFLAEDETYRDRFQQEAPANSGIPRWLVCSQPSFLTSRASARSRGS